MQESLSWSHAMPPLRKRCPTSLAGLVTVVSLVAPRVAHAPNSPPKTLASFDVIVDGLQSPTHLAIDRDGRVLVSEGHAGALLRIAPDQAPTVLLGSVTGPQGVAVDSTGTIFIAAEGLRRQGRKRTHGAVLRLDPETHASVIEAGGFIQPKGLAITPDDLDILLSANGRTRRPTEEGSVYRVTRNGTITRIAGGFHRPQGVLRLPDGDTLVAADRFEQGGVRLDGSLFLVNAEGTVSPVITRALQEPHSVARDPLHGLYVSGRDHGTSEPDAGVLLKRRPDGALNVFAEGLREPRGLAFNARGDLYVVEAGRHRLLRFIAPDAPAPTTTPPAFTRLTQLALGGLAEPGALLTVLGGSAASSGYADPSGHFTLPVTLQENTSNALELFATARAGDGLTSAPAAFTVIHDNRPPTAVLLSPPSGAVLRGIVALDATASDENGVTLVMMQVDGQTVWAGNAPPFSTSFDSRGLSDGPHLVSAISRDVAHNETSASAHIITDNTPPAIAIATPSDGGILSAGTPILRIEYSDATSGIHLNTLRVVLDGSDISPLFSVSPTAATASLATSLTNGPHVLQATITDQAGNIASATAHFVLATGPDFALAVAPSVATAIQGGTTTFSVNVMAFNDYANLVSLSVAGLPHHSTATFSPPQVAPGASSTLAVTAPESVSPGHYAVTLAGTGLIDGAPASRNTGASLTVIPRGVTALSGRVLDEEERPLANVAIRIGSAWGTTDGAGNFLITDPPTGEQVVLVDGSTASTPALSYPTIPMTMTIEPNRNNVLGFTPHLHAQPVTRTLPITPGVAATVTDPAIPGLVVQIPSGVTIVGWDGRPNTRIGFRVVQPDRSPLPPLELPPGAVAGPLYMFYFGKVGGGTPTAPVPITGPNDVGGLPGEQVDLYFYDEAPDGSRPNRWARYGTGTVSADATQIIPDIDPATGQPYGMPRFCCGAWRPVYPPQNRPPSTAAPNLPALGQGPHAGEPVDLASGLFVLHKTDMVLPGRSPLAFTRTYRTLDNSSGPFGPGTSHNYDVFVQSLSADALLLTLPGNSRAIFSRQSDGRFLNTTDPGLKGTSLTTAPDAARVLGFKDGTTWVFDAAGRLIRQVDRNANTVTIARDGQGRIARITEPAGRQLTLTYDGTSLRVRTLTDPLGRVVQYAYDGSGRLATVTDPVGGVTAYTYDGANRLMSIRDSRGITFLQNQYDATGRVSRQTQADGGVWQFTYAVTAGLLTETRVTDTRGHVTVYRFNSSGYLIEQTDSLGQATMFERQVGTNVLLTVTDSLKRTTRFTYDSEGNVTTMIDPDGQVRTFTYDAPFNRLASLTDPLGHTTRFTYDGKGNLIRVTDPSGHSTSIAYNPFGQPNTVTDALGHTTRFAYDDAGNLTQIADPLGHVTTRSYDGVSRLTAQTDPRGKVTSFVYDALNRLITIIDPLEGQTKFGYDPNGNLLTVTDARNYTITHTYDVMDQLSARTDPLGAIEQFTYDTAGNLLSTTDRKGQTTAFTYDPLNRRVQANYADGAVARFVYDAGGRLVLADDTADPHRPISLIYDRLDRLITETTALGAVRYGYDALGRRVRMSVNDINPVIYTYDMASRLERITQAPLNPATFEHDAAGRRTRLTLPNGVSTEYQYDVASRLTALIYRNATGVLGDLTYTYDAAGNRIGVGGSFARTLLPDPVPSATYDAANRQLSFGDKVMTYDANGSVVSITETTGMTTFTWDARNRLVALNGPAVVGSFAYDAFGRRTKSLMDGQAAQFRYDGPDIIQKLTNAIVEPYLRTLNIDETLARRESEFYVGDALGSTVALTDLAGGVATIYTYEPFGRAATSGVASGNAFQSAGREYDGPTGLYYLRARYYSPTLHRFISEDPVGFAGGDVNLYGYVLNNPVGGTDPFGLKLCKTNLPGMGDTYLDDSVAPLVEDFIRRNTANGIDVRFTEAFRPTEYQDALTRNPNAITPAPPSTSLHEAGFAFDVSWRRIRPEDRRTVVENARRTGLRWGGNFKKPDPVHFYKEIPGGRAKRSVYIEGAQGDFKKGNVPLCP
jgi:RHS repeat-associated protein